MKCAFVALAISCSLNHLTIIFIIKIVDVDVKYILLFIMCKIFGVDI